MLALFLGSACASLSADGPPPQESPVHIPAVLASDQGESARMPLMLSEAVNADAVFVGTLVEAGPPPTAWSGLVSVAQSLTYDVTEVLKGTLATGRITVSQLIVARSPLCNRDVPGLTPRYVQVGQVYIVLVGKPDSAGQLFTASDSVGLTVATDAVVASVRAALK